LDQLAAADVNNFRAGKFPSCEQDGFFLQQKRHARAGKTNHPTHVARRIGRDFRSQPCALLFDEYSEVADQTALYKAFAGARLRVALQTNCTENNKDAKQL